MTFPNFSKSRFFLSAFIALFLAHLIWGANFVVAKVTLQEIPVMSLAFLRFSLASIFLIPFLWIERRQLKMQLKDLPRLCVAGVLMITFHIYLFYEGLSRTTALNASALTLVVPILSMLCGWWFLKEKVFWINILGTVLGLIGGVVILGLPLLFTSGFNIESTLGNLLIILSGIVFVAGATIARPLLARYHFIVVTIGTFLVGVVTFAGPATLDYLQNPLWVYKVTVLGGLGFLYITILSTISAFFMFQWGLEKIGLAKASLFSYIDPVVATLLAVPFLQERVSFSFVVGTCLIILGVYWGTLGKEQHHNQHFQQHHK
ncbi:hypothetical protein A2631_00870 [Candidatus Daviesbacteria bacterium RIFCSPHIGHO2_01_FULL_44_29]|uniref:EamA domain-containing protein n=1 Tax=Candidatus Daviesbacteria bacterium RIFCSPHIGHO2_02_FULL_43_12 TaxID=1797776 RepID=A0A1F5KI31_9BACT|nr:MAG: hypothetical protein A2631_00870 [Candidatus Daviesbacteria bacterium RIFCSPHIGHO2_01_FULL_44_29]OGE40271.1 MAG: hypothetical protein A3D25_05335 [Candidatus Daviesbacteria bacterium RIFCSPHIGHO2_02_FULL_43_12]OGE69070.1 MAG: hypothetical protein A3B55_02415 [Candidatus Daviesbacteria bacterium RIFCSPLOWO2_01_FULL_43_15]